MLFHEVGEFLFHSLYFAYFLGKKKKNEERTKHLPLPWTSEKVKSKEVAEISEREKDKE